MIRRSLAILIAILALSAGAAAAWVALSVPRDVRAEAMLKEARGKLQAGDREAARAELQEIVKTYPRTDAASAASYALFRLYEQERAELRGRVETLELAQGADTRAREGEGPAREADRKRIAELEEKLTALEQRVAEVAKAQAKPKTATKRR